MKWLMRSWVREERKKCVLCDDEYESVSHILWKCPVCNNLLCRSFSGMDLNVFRAGVVLKKNTSLCWVGG